MSYLQTMPGYYIESSSPVTRPCRAYAFPIDAETYVIPQPMAKSKTCPRSYTYTELPYWYQCYTLPTCPEDEVVHVEEDEDIYPRDCWNIYDPRAEEIASAESSKSEPTSPSSPRCRRPLTCPPDDPVLMAFTRNPTLSPNSKRKSYSPSLLRRSIFNRRSKPDLTVLDEKCSACGFPIKDEPCVSLKAEEDRRDVYHRVCFNCSECTCGNCQVMPTARECVCCADIDRVTDVINECEDITCITNHPGFHPVCLNIHVLRVAYYQYRQQFGDRPEQNNE